jgi:hypothetical protein
MDNVFSKGILLAAATALVGYGASALNANFWQAIIAIAFGVVIFVGREVLKKYGYDVTKVFGRDKGKK